LFGSGTDTLVHLHGGPGGGHGAALPYARLSSDRLQVLLDDQLGCGASDRPDDEALWTVPRFAGEVIHVLDALGLDQAHLMGRSWGGMLAQQVALDHPERVRTLILSNTTADMTDGAASMARCYAGLPREARRSYYRGRTAPTKLEVWSEGASSFLGRHFQRPWPFSEEAAQAMWQPRLANAATLTDLPVYRSMWGPDPSTCSGSLLDWSVIDRLHELQMPTLILCGWYDELSPDLHRAIADRVPNNEFVIFGNSSHVITEEKECELYLATIKNFVERHSAFAQGDKR